MDGDNEDLDDFMDEVSSKYSNHFNQLDQIIDAESEVRVFGITEKSHIKALVRVSSMTAFIIFGLVVVIHWLSYSVSRSAGPVTSFEVLTLTGLMFLNIGIYAVSIAERLNLLLMKMQLKFSLLRLKSK